MPMASPDEDEDAADPTDAVTDEATTRELQQCPKKRRGYLRKLREHEEKLRLYQSNPDAYDNKGFLKGAKALGLGDGIRQQIIQRRIRKLQHDIESYREQYQRCLANNMIA